jgi:hypothetical protein
MMRGRPEEFSKSVLALRVKGRMRVTLPGQLFFMEGPGGALVPDYN